jgi:hypothetical protein
MTCQAYKYTDLWPADSPEGKLALSIADLETATEELRAVTDVMRVRRDANDGPDPSDVINAALKFFDDNRISPHCPAYFSAKDYFTKETEHAPRYYGKVFFGYEPAQPPGCEH